MAQDYSKPFIVKIQRSLATSGDTPSILIYNKDRSVMWEEPESPAMKRLMGSRMKVFYWATIDAAGGLAISAIHPARDPGW